MSEQNSGTPENLTDGATLIGGEVTSPTDGVADPNKQEPTGNQNPDPQDGGEPGDGGKPGDGGTPDEGGQKPEGAPEKYEDFAPVDGKTFDSEVLTGFSEAAKEANMTQEKAQVFLNKMAPILDRRTNEQLAELRSSWTEASKADTEFGGAKLNENMAMAIKAREQFGTPELKTLLNESGLGNHPEVIRFFYRAGKALSEDTFVGGSKTDGEIKDPAKTLYPDMN